MHMKALDFLVMCGVSGAVAYIVSAGLINFLTKSCLS